MEGKTFGEERGKCLENGGENFWRMEGETLRMALKTFGE